MTETRPANPQLAMDALKLAVEQLAAAERQMQTARELAERLARELAPRRPTAPAPPPPWHPEDDEPPPRAA